MPIPTSYGLTLSYRRSVASWLAAPQDEEHDLDRYVTEVAIDVSQALEEVSATHASAVDIPVRLGTARVGGIVASEIDAEITVFSRRFGSLASEISALSEAEEALDTRVRQLLRTVEDLDERVETLRSRISGFAISSWWISTPFYGIFLALGGLAIALLNRLSFDVLTPSDLQGAAMSVAFSALSVSAGHLIGLGVARRRAGTNAFGVSLLLLVLITLGTIFLAVIGSSTATFDGLSSTWAIAATSLMIEAAVVLASVLRASDERTSLHEAELARKRFSRDLLQKEDELLSIKANLSLLMHEQYSVVEQHVRAIRALQNRSKELVLSYLATLMKLGVDPEWLGHDFEVLVETPMSVVAYEDWLEQMGTRLKRPEGGPNRAYG